MAPAMADGLLSFLRGPEPPLRSDGEDLDAFQTRLLDWLIADRKHTKALLWAVFVMLVNANWLHIGG